MIRILITDDSDTVLLLLKTILEKEPDIKVIGQAKNGREAVDLARKLKPDLITMDIRMPVMDGFEATRRIMSEDPIPIVVISSNVDDELHISFRAIEEGALAVIEKPPSIQSKSFDAIRRKIVETVRAMVEVKMVRRINRDQKKRVEIQSTLMCPENSVFELISIGCSTGGPQALQCILSALPVNFPVPILLVQHMSRGFLCGLVDWLKKNTPLGVKLAEDREVFAPATVYFAPEEKHLVVRRMENQLLAAALSDDPPVGQFRPSVTVMFQSIARVCKKKAIGVLLSGMGDDGAQGLLEMRRAGAHTIIQDKDSVVVFGMPGAALALDAVDRTVKLDNIAPYLERAIQNQQNYKKK